MIPIDLLNKIVDIKIDEIYPLDELGNKYKNEIRVRFGTIITTMNVYEIAFRTRDYLKDKHKHELPMNETIEEIFLKATQFHETVNKKG